MSITIINYDSNKIIAKFSGEIDESNADYVRCQLDELIDSLITADQSAKLANND